MNRKTFYLMALFVVLVLLAACRGGLARLVTSPTPTIAPQSTLLVTAQPVILSEAKNLVCAKNETLRFAQGDTKSVQICQG